MKPTLTFGGVLSVYEGDHPVYLYESLHTLIHGQSRKLDACVGVIEGLISQALEEVVAQFLRRQNMQQTAGTPTLTS